MSIYEVLTYPDPFLRKKAKPVDVIDGEIREIVDNMVSTMFAAKGIGLAATQVGVERRIIVLDVPDRDDYRRGDGLITLINPEIVECEGETTFEEGCLSVPDITADVKRYAGVTVLGLDREGDEVVIKAEGLLSVALQHEVDHLEGILFIDRLSRLKRGLIKNRLKKAVG